MTASRSFLHLSTAAALVLAACGEADPEGEVLPAGEVPGAEAPDVAIGVTAPLAELEEAEAAGFEYIELRTSEIAELPETEWQREKARIQQLGIPTPVSNYFIPGSIKVTGPEVNEQEQMEYVRRALQRVSELGVEYVVFGSGGAREVPEGFPKEQAFQQLVDFAKRIAPIAAEHDITILVEPLRRQETNIVNTAREGFEWVQAVDHPNFQLMVDFYHLAVENEDPQIIRDAADYIHHLHIANPEGRVYPQDWAEEEQYAGFFRALRDIGYDERISVEANTEDMAGEAPAAIELIRQGFDPEYQLPG